MAGKRAGDENALVAKRTKTDQTVLKAKIKRVSALKAPIMHLTGHTNAVLSCAFSPDGRHLASASADRTVLLWGTSGDCENYGIIKGHNSAILQVQWSRDGSHVYTASSDFTVGVWDAETGQVTRKFKGHKGIVNSCSANKRGQEMVASVSDDSMLMIWDLRQKTPVKSYDNNSPLTSVAFGVDGGIAYSAGIDNQIKAWDLRTDQISYELSGHYDTVTGLRLSPKGDYLLSNAMDNTVKIWDIKPFAPANRECQSFEGAPHGFEKNLLRPCWSPDADFIACGSGDRSVVVWSVSKNRIVYKLPGHKGCVIDVDWSGTILASASSDKTIFMGELNTDEVK